MVRYIPIPTSGGVRVRSNHAERIIIIVNINEIMVPTIREYDMSFVIVYTIPVFLTGLQHTFHQIVYN